ENAKNRSRTLPIESRRIRREGELATDAAAFLEFLRLPFDGGGEPEVVQHLGTQASGDLANGLYRLVDQLEHRLGLADQRRLVWRQLLGDAGQIHLQTRKSLAELVVDLARDPCPLLLADRLQSGGQRAQILLRLP